MISSRKALLYSTLAGLALFWPLLLWGYWPADWPLDLSQHAIGRDFVNLWGSGRLLLEGHMAVLFDADAYIAHLRRVFAPELAPHIWSYPPTSFLLAVPLAHLPYGLALALWTAAGCALLIWAARLRLHPAERRTAVLLALLAPATALNAICGQNGFFTAALLAGGVLLLEERPLLAGILIGLLSFKPHFGIVIAPVLLALGAWRAIAAALVTSVALILVSCALFGVEPWRAFLAVTLPNQTATLQEFNGFYTHMLVSPYAALRHLGTGHALAIGVQAAITAAAIGATMISVRKTRDGDARLLLVAAATFLATPYALTYDLPILALAIGRMLARKGLPELKPAEAVVLGAAWALALAAPQLSRLGLALGPPVILSVFAWSIIGLREINRGRTDFTLAASGRA